MACCFFQTFSMDLSGTWPQCTRKHNGIAEKKIANVQHTKMLRLQLSGEAFLLYRSATASGAANMEDMYRYARETEEEHRNT
jgi:hypothetical protein